MTRPVSSLGTLSWCCTIPGEPVGKGRPRFVRSTGRTYTPDKTASWEAFAVATLRADWQMDPLDCPVQALVCAWFPRPEKLCKGKHAQALEVPHLAQPDADNVLKIAMDAAQKAGVLRNDSRVYEARCVKRYANNGESPRVVLALKWEAMNV